jgi:membrane-associated PAP2 superfamily phosphatase
VALAAGLAVGVLFAFGQEARGAHFLSHDLTSAILVWYVQLGLYLRYAASETAIDSALHQRLTA